MWSPHAFLQTTPYEGHSVIIQYWLQTNSFPQVRMSEDCSALGVILNEQTDIILVYQREYRLVKMPQ